MRNVILFIRRYLTFFTFLILQIVSLWFLYSFNQFHQAQFLQTANELTGAINTRYKNFENFFLQGEENRRLHRVNDSLLIGERTAEQIKIQVGAALKDIDNPPDDFAVNGRDLVTGIPKQIMVSYQEIAEALDKSIFKIEEAILKALEQTPPELAADIYRRGLYITGGGALLRGLDRRLSSKIKLPVHVADDPLKSVVRGTGIALKNYDRYPFVMR